MTYQRALEIIKDNMSFESGVINEATDMIEIAVEKQTPQKPMPYNNYQRMCECGALVKTYQNYCYDCGQALDWSASDDE